MFIAAVLSVLVAAPTPSPTRCKIRLTEAALEVRVGRNVVAEQRWEPTDLPSRAPRSSSASRDARAELVLHRTNDPARTLVGLREDWSGMPGDGLGNLFEVRCDAVPSVRRVLHVDGVDFGQGVALPDGRIVFGGFGGLKILDPDLMMLMPLTIPPAFGKGCWAAVDDQPVVAADVAPAQYRAGEIAFVRGGPCGYEAEMTHAPMVFDLATGAVRPLVRASDIVVDAAGAVTVGDGAGTCEQTPSDGAVWRSTDGGATFTRVALGGLPPGHIGAVADLAQIATKAASTTFALFDICRTGGASVGGELVKSEGGLTWSAVPFPEPALDDVAWDAGSAILAIEARGANLFAQREAGNGKRVWWRSKDLGASWKRGGQPPARERVPKTLAAELGVASVNALHTDKARGFAWASTSDGLYRKPLPAPGPKKATVPSPWVRVFPAHH